MTLYPLGQLTMDQLAELADVEDRGVLPELWDDRKLGQLAEEEQAALLGLHKRLLTSKVLLANEATIWARAIYPILAMAERDHIQAFAEVPLSGSFHGGDLRGTVDGALARMGILADAMPPYLLVVEAKRGVEGHDPVAQLLGGVLCAAQRNHKQRARDEHVIYGAYTVADVWTFLRATISSVDGERPRIVVEFSRQYTETTEAATILLLIKSMLVELLET